MLEKDPDPRENRVIFIFIDGLGIGSCDPRVNPLAAFQPKILRLYQNALGPFPFQGQCLVTDAQLNVAGTPQSATGQTTLLTGVNAAAYLGHHLPGFPNRTLKELIAKHSLFRRLKQKGMQMTFANAYTPQFFEKRHRWSSVTTVMCETARVRLCRLDDLLAERSVFMDFTNQLLLERGHHVPLRTPQQAARILLDLSKEYHLCLYEYFLTDLTGHRGDLEEAVRLLEQLDVFLFEILKGVDLETTSVIISSDHGNIEKMDQKQHTTNPVGTLLWGPIQEEAYQISGAFAQTGVTPMIESVLSASLHQYDDVRRRTG